MTVGSAPLDKVWFLNIFAELRKFFKRLPDLLDGPDARFSFFNGLGATSVSQLLLSGFDVDTNDMQMHFFTMSILTCLIVTYLKLVLVSNGTISKLDWTTRKTNDGEDRGNTLLCLYTACRSAS